MPADFSDKLTAGMQQGIEQGMRETREALAQKDATLAKQRAAALAEVLNEAGTIIYHSQQMPPGPTGTSRQIQPPPRAKPDLRVLTHAAGWSTRIMRKPASR